MVSKYIVFDQDIKGLSSRSISFVSLGLILPDRINHKKSTISRGMG
jgi:hypothetical protein